MAHIQFCFHLSLVLRCFKPKRWRLGLLVIIIRLLAIVQRVVTMFIKQLVVKQLTILQVVTKLIIQTVVTIQLVIQLVITIKLSILKAIMFMGMERIILKVNYLIKTKQEHRNNLIMVN